MRARRTFKELSPRLQISIVLTTIIELTLMITALRDLRQRPAEQVKGSKKLWALVSLITMFGPLTYFIFGRRKSSDLLVPHRIK